MKTIKGLSILFLAVLACLNTNAQETKAVQIAFIYPVGTAGTNSVDYKNNFSFNIIGGLNGGVNGFEFGSVANINQGDVTGCQYLEFAMLHQVIIGEELFREFAIWHREIVKNFLCLELQT